MFPWICVLKFNQIFKKLLLIIVRLKKTKRQAESFFLTSNCFSVKFPEIELQTKGHRLFQSFRSMYLIFTCVDMC